MRQAIALSVLGLVSFGVFLALKAPASLVIDRAPPALRLGSVTGTLWSGQATEAALGALPLGKLAWRTHPLPLLTGATALDIALAGNQLTGQGELSFGRHTLTLDDLHVKGDGAALTPLLTQYITTLSGYLEVDIDRLRLTPQGPAEAKGQARWREARLTSPVALALGEVRMSLTQDGDKALVRVSNTGEALKLNGTIELLSGWRYQTNLQFTPTPATPETVRRSLRLLGPADSSGAVTLRAQGRLPAPAL